MALQLLEGDAGIYAVPNRFGDNGSATRYVKRKYDQKYKEEDSETSSETHDNPRFLPVEEKSGMPVLCSRRSCFYKGLKGKDQSPLASCLFWRFLVCLGGKRLARTGSV